MEILCMDQQPFGSILPYFLFCSWKELFRQSSHSWFLWGLQFILPEKTTNICSSCWIWFIIMTDMMVLQEIMWSTIISCFTFKVLHRNANVDPLLEWLFVLGKKKTIELPLETWLTMIPLIQPCFSLLLGVLRRFLDFWEKLLQKP